MAIIALVRTSENVLTPLVLGVLFGLAFDPVVGVLRRRLRCSRATATLVVAVALTLVFGGIVLLLGPKAVDQASTFAEEVPATIEQFYSWPLIGDRLEQNDAAGEAQKFVDDLPTRFDTDSISKLASRLLGGLGAALLVLVTTVAVLLDGDAIVRRARRLVPPARRERADEVGRIVYRSVAAVLRRLADGGVAERHGDPHRGTDPRRAARPARCDLGGDHQPHPADRWAARRCLLRAAGVQSGPTHRGDRPRRVPGIPAAREPHHPADDHRPGGAPLAAHDDARRADRRRGGRRSRRTGGHPTARRREVRLARRRRRAGARAAQRRRQGRRRSSDSSPAESSSGKS